MCCVGLVRGCLRRVPTHHVLLEPGELVANTLLFRNTRGVRRVHHLRATGRSRAPPPLLIPGIKLLPSSPPPVANTEQGGTICPRPPPGGGPRLGGKTHDVPALAHFLPSPNLEGVRRRRQRIQSRRPGKAVPTAGRASLGGKFLSMKKLLQHRELTLFAAGCRGSRSGYTGSQGGRCKSRVRDMGWSLGWGGCGCTGAERAVRQYCAGPYPSSAAPESCGGCAQGKPYLARHPSLRPPQLGLGATNRLPF